MLRLTCIVVVHGVTGLRGPGVGTEGTTGGSDCAWCCCRCESGLLVTAPHPAFQSITVPHPAFDRCTSSSFQSLYLIHILITIPHPAFETITFLCVDALCFSHVFNIDSVIFPFINFCYCYLFMCTFIFLVCCLLSYICVLLSWTCYFWYFSSLKFENVECCKLQWMCVAQRIVLNKSYLLLLLTFFFMGIVRGYCLL